MQKQIRLRLAEGVHLTCLPADRYKTAVLSAGFVLPLGEARTLTALTPQVLHRGTRGLPDLTALGCTLDGLYGARMYPYVRKTGDAVTVGTIADVIDERYVPAGEELTARLAHLMHALWHDPYQKGGLLCPDYTAAEGANLADKIEAQRNDPRSYAMRRLQELLCAGEPYGYNEYGDAAEARAADPAALTARWGEVTEHAPIELFYCGSLSPEQAAACFAPFGAARQVRQMPVTAPHLAAKEVRTVIEERAVTQGKLSLGFSTGLTGHDARYAALMLFNTLFGGYTGSRLFVNVREKRSLCYYANSSLDKLKGIMMVSSGIENANFETTRDEILRQLDELKAKPVPADELEGARRTLLSQLRTVKDNPVSLEYFFQSQAVGGLDYDLDTLLDRIACVTADEVRQAAQGVTLDTVYFMKGAGK